MKIILTKNLEKAIYKWRFCRRAMWHEFPQFPDEEKYLTKQIYAIKGKDVKDPRVKAELSDETAYLFSLKNGTLRPWHVTFKQQTIKNYFKGCERFKID